MAVTRKTHILFLLLLLASGASAQKKNLLVRTLDWGYQLVQGDSANPKKKYFFVVPIVSYKPETRWQLGLSFAHYFRAKQNDSLTNTRPSVVRFNVSYTQNNQWSMRPQFDVFTRGNKYNLRGTFQYMKFIENYWGVGKYTTEATKELYGFYQERADFKTMRLVRKGIYAGIQFNYEHLHGLTNPATGPMRSSGIDGVNGYSVLGFGPAVSFDNRDHIYFPKRGHFIDLYSAFYLHALSSTGAFNTIVLDARKYVGLWKENVLAFQLYGNFGMGRVPYRMMGTLGNDSYMRGYYFGRFRDLNAMAVQAEFRKHIWGPASMVLFGGAGNVSRSVDGHI
jgi:outer membrane protein assembly factor BamA